MFTTQAQETGCVIIKKEKNDKPTKTRKNKSNKTLAHKPTIKTLNYYVQSAKIIAYSNHSIIAITNLNFKTDKPSTTTDLYGGHVSKLSILRSSSADRVYSLEINRGSWRVKCRIRISAISERVTCLIARCALQDVAM